MGTGPVGVWRDPFFTPKAGPLAWLLPREDEERVYPGDKGVALPYASTNPPLSMVAWAWSFETALKVYLNRWDMSQSSKGLVITDKQICTKTICLGSSLGGLRRQIPTAHSTSEDKAYLARIFLTCFIRAW